MRVWDIRMESSALCKTTLRLDGSRGEFIMAFHPNAPVIAYSRRGHSGVRVLSFDDFELCTLKPKASNATQASAFGFMGGANKQTSRDVTSLCWHARELVLCVGHADAAYIFVAGNTRLRGIFSPQELNKQATVN